MRWVMLATVCGVAACASRTLPNALAAPTDLAAAADLAPRTRELFVITTAPSATTVHELDIDTGQLVATASLPDVADDAVFAADGLHLALFNSQRLVRLGPGLAQDSSVAIAGQPLALAVTADGSIAYTADLDGSVRSYSLPSGALIDARVTGAQAIYAGALALSPDEHLLGVAVNGAGVDEADLIAVASGKLSPPRVVKCPSARCFQPGPCALTPDGSELVVFDVGDAVFWAARTADASADPNTFAFAPPMNIGEYQRVQFDSDGTSWVDAGGVLYRGSFRDANARAALTPGGDRSYQAVALDRSGTRGWVLERSAAGPALMNQLEPKSAALTPLGWDLSRLVPGMVTAMIYVER